MIFLMKNLVFIELLYMCYHSPTGTFYTESYGNAVKKSIIWSVTSAIQRKQFHCLKVCNKTLFNSKKSLKKIINIFRLSNAIRQGSDVVL